jgi:PII-like signaling protein
VHDKRRLEIIVERMALTRAGNILEAAGLTGYTVLPAMAGFGNSAHWQSAGDLSTTQDMVVVIAIGDNEKIERALEDLARLLSRHIGVLSVGDVQVMRPGRF